MNYELYTDGSCNPNPGEGGWAFIIVEVDEPRSIKSTGSGYEPVSTNNRMEMMALIKGLEKYNEIKTPEDTLTVVTDSMYLLNGTTRWSKKWCKNNWTRKPSLKNVDLWKQIRILDDLTKGVFRKVKGHAGDYYNEQVDVLAKACCSKNIC